MRNRMWILGIGVVGACLGGFLLGSVRLPRAHAQQSATITFILDVSTPVTVQNFPTEPGDLVIFTGKSTETVLAGSCGDGVSLYPVQSGVIVDPAGNRAFRLAGIIPVSQTANVPNGTKLGNLSSLGTCSYGPVTYLIFSGTVQ